MLKVLMSFVVLVFLCACSEGPLNKNASFSGVEQTESELDQNPAKETSKYLAYIHNFSVELEREKISFLHKKIISACEQDREYQCVILSDNYSSGEYSSGRITLRLKPEGVGFFSQLVSQNGNIASQSRKAEDLTVSILDTGKRIEQLERFEKKLLKLESRSDADIDSLLKVASQLAETQTQLEYLQGSRAALLQRVQTDILNINLNRIYDESFLGTISDAFGDFGESFTYAIEGLINAIAYIIPWTLFLMLMFFIVRAIFRFLNIKIFKGRQKVNTNDGA